MPPHPAIPALRGSCVVSLRPVDGHAALRRAAAVHGARVLALSPWRIEPRADAGAGAALEAALRGDCVLFTSPAAVRAAQALRPLRPRRGQSWLAVGAGTAAALRRAGVAGAVAPSRMDSEGVLALPELQDVRGRGIGLVTAPGGRDAIAAELARRGARVHRADVYARVAIAPSARALARLRAVRAPLWLALSSGEALQLVLAGLPDALSTKLRGARVLAASARLADLAQALGFREVRIAADARPRSLLAAAGGRPAPRSVASDSMRTPLRRPRR